MKVQIIGGSYPIQVSHISRHSGWVIQYDKWNFIAYTPRAAIKQIDKISDNKNIITFKVYFSDGAEIIATGDRKIFDALYAAMTTGPQQDDIAVKDIGARPYIHTAISVAVIVLLLVFWGYQLGKPPEKIIAQASCCRVMGMATACSKPTDYLAEICGKQIDGSTADLIVRGRKQALCMEEAVEGAQVKFLQMEIPSGHNCQLVESRMRKETGGELYKPE